MIDMKNMFKAFTLGLTLGVLLMLALAYQNHKMNSILSTEDMNKKLRCLQAASRKTLVEETISASALKKNEYITK
jgi:hypothetical protein